MQTKATYRVSAAYNRLHKLQNVAFSNIIIIIIIDTKILTGSN